MDIGALAISLAAFALKALLYLAFFFATVIATIKLSFRAIARERRKLAAAQLGDIDRMSGDDFEHYLEVLFERLGYETEFTERYDKGADLILKKEGLRTAVQAKCRTRERVGVEAIRAVVAAQRPYRCARGLVVTNSYFTRPAIQAARDNNIELWNRDELANMILALNSPGQTLPIPGPIAWLLEAPRTAPLGLLPAPRPDPGHTCATCGTQVPPGVRRYCLDKPERFGGLVYCMDHQRQLPHPPGPRRPPAAPGPPSAHAAD